MNKEPLKVAVILPVFNAEATIISAINSVLKQSYKNFIVYVIDDGSEDNTANLIENLHNEKIVLLKNENNKGVSYSRNRGICLSREPLIAFIDSDDVWGENKLKKQVSLLIDSGNSIVGSSYSYITPEKKSVIVAPKVLSQKDFIKKKFRVCFSSILFRRCILGDLKFKKIGHEDFEFLYRLMQNAPQQELIFVLENNVQYFVRNNSLSSQKFKAAFWHWKVLRNDFKFGIIKSYWLFFNYAFRAILFRKNL